MFWEFTPLRGITCYSQAYEYAQVHAWGVHRASTGCPTDVRSFIYVLQLVVIVNYLIHSVDCDVDVSVAMGMPSKGSTGYACGS